MNSPRSGKREGKEGGGRGGKEGESAKTSRRIAALLEPQRNDSPVFSYHVAPWCSEPQGAARDGLAVYDHTTCDERCLSLGLISCGG